MLIEGYSFIFVWVKSIERFGNCKITFLYPLGILGVSIISFSITFSKKKEEYSLDRVVQYNSLNIISNCLIQGCTDTIDKHLGIYKFSSLEKKSFCVFLPEYELFLMKNSLFSLNNLYLSYKALYEFISSYIIKQAKYLFVYTALYNWLSNTTQ